MKKQILFTLLCGLILLLGSGLFHTAIADELHIFVGAGLRQPVDGLVRSFEKKTGHKVAIDYGGSGQLMSRIKVTRKGDLFVPGAFFYIEKLNKDGIIHSYRAVVKHTPVIGVYTARAEHVTCFDDLTKPGLHLAMGDPEAMAFGRTAMAICEKSEYGFSRISS